MIYRENIDVIQLVCMDLRAHGEPAATSDYDMRIGDRNPGKKVSNLFWYDISNKSLSNKILASKCAL